MEMNSRNWERLLVATLQRARDHLPGPGCTEADLVKLDDIKRKAAKLGIDIDEILEEAFERGVIR